MTLPNTAIAELMALRAEELSGDRQRAYRRASRRAYQWPQEVGDMVADDRPLTDLKGIGAKLSGLIRSWLDDPPDVPEPPPIRSGFMSFAEARADAGKSEAFSYNGDLQMHSVASDGRATIEEMARAGLALGYRYIAITDHSKGLPIAGGIDEEELAQQGREIDGVNEKLASEGHDFRILRSMEMNLNPQGGGDMDPDALGQLDIVLGSFHSSLRKKEDQTDRYIAALRNPDIHVLGHPRGRIYNFRAGLVADWPKVFAVAAEEGKALECDCFPDRQDLNVELLTAARDAGTWISMGTDAHNEAEMGFMPIGVASALRAGISRDRILNLMTAEEIVAWARDAELRRTPV
ncbi:MAG TPA: PHP domain-containing protein [Actinomycetota bacterium]|nr:PHP domain-containing protein [Actinomycetota bacterium]